MPCPPFASFALQFGVLWCNLWRAFGRIWTGRIQSVIISRQSTSQRCGGWKEQKECILDTLTSMVVNAAQMHRAQVQANARIAAENTKSGVEEALSGIYDSDSGDDAQQDSAGDDAAQ